VKVSDAYFITQIQQLPVRFALKTIRVDDDIHQQLTGLLGELMAKMKNPNIQDIIEELIANNSGANK
jgi:hypothetical protein